MPKVAVYKTDGKKAGEIELSDAVFGAKVNKAVMHEAVVAHLANKRQGTQSALTRAEVRGGGIKPFRQKGTGRARQGSSRRPGNEGGGVVFAPKPRSYAQKVNKKARRLALVSAMSSKVADENILVMEDMKLKDAKTKEMAVVLKNLKVEKALIVTAEKDDMVVRAAGNIPGVKTAMAGALCVYDILKYDTFIVTKDAVKKIEEVYA